MKLIDKDVIDVLKGCGCAVNAIVLPDVQLDRKLYTKVNKVLMDIGGKWNRKAKAHLFDDDVEEVFNQVVRSGEYEAQLDELNKVYNFFETPYDVAEELVTIACIQDGERVLEPSAGKGAIADAIVSLSDADLQCYELHPDNVMALAVKFHNVDQVDFLETDERYDVIIANPPFSKGRDAEHIMHMISLADRKVVSVCSAAIRYRETGKYKQLTEMLDNYNHFIVDLPEGSFKESGTMVKACILIVEMD